MTLVTYVPASGYSSSEQGVINAGGGLSFDIGAALTAGSGQFTIDDQVSPLLVSVLDKYPGLVRSGTTPGTPVVADNIIPLMAHTTKISPGDVLAMDTATGLVVGSSAGALGLTRVAADNLYVHQDGTGLPASAVLDASASPHGIDSTGVADTNVLAYNASSGKFKPSSGSTGAAVALIATAVKTASYPAAVSDFVPIDASGGAVPIALPSAPVDKARIGLKIIAQATVPNPVTITAGGTDHFNKAGGSTALTLTALFQAVLLQYAAGPGLWYAQSTDSPISQPGGAAGLGTDGKHKNSEVPSSVISTITQSIQFWKPGTFYPAGSFILDHLAAANLNTPRYQLRWNPVAHTTPTSMAANFPWGNDLTAGGDQWHILPTNGTFRGPFLTTSSGNIGTTSGALSTSGNTSTIPAASTSAQIMMGEQVVLTTGVATVGTTASPLTTGGTITTLPLVPAYALPGGTVITITDGGSHTQTWTVSTDTQAGAPSVPVNSQTPNFAYTSGSAVTSVGGVTQVFIATATVPVSAGAVSIPVVPVPATFAFPSGSTISLGAWKGQQPQYTPHDLIINPDTGEIIRALFSDAGNLGVWNAATIGPNGSAPRWTYGGIHPLHSLRDPGTLTPATGKPDADNPGLGMHTLRTVVRAPRKKPLAMFRTLADFDVGGGTGTGAAFATNYTDPPSPSGAVKLVFNSKWVKTLPAAVDVSNQIVLATIRIPGSGTTRTGISGPGAGGFLQLSSGGAAAFGAGNYAQYQLVASNDSYLGEDFWDIVGCGPKDWVQIGTGANMAAINALRLSLVSGATLQSFGIFKIEMIDNNGQTASKGDGRAKQILWFDDTSETNWLSSSSGISVGTLSSALVTTAPITSLPCAPTMALVANQQIAVSSGSNVQMFTVMTATAAGAGPIPVASQTPSFAFPTNSVVALPTSAVALMEQFNFPGTVASAGAITNATVAPSSMTPRQIRDLNFIHGWQFALHYYFANDGNDPQTLVQGAMDAFVQRAKHGLRANPARGDEDFAYHDVTHATQDNKDTIRRYFRSARRYNSAEIQIETLPPPNIYRHRSKGVATADINDWFNSPVGVMSTGAPITSIPLQVKAGQNLAINQPIMMSQTTNSQVFVVTANTGYASLVVPVASQTPNFAYTAVSNIISGVATLTGALTTGAAITSLPASPAYPLLQGMAITLFSGANSQTFLVSANTAAGSGSIPVNSQVPNFAYPIGTFITCPGSTLRGFVDQAIDMLGMAQTVWDPSFTAGEELGFQNLMLYLDSQRSNIDVVTFADAINPWIKSA